MDDTLWMVHFALRASGAVITSRKSMRVLLLPLQLQPLLLVLFQAEQIAARTRHVTCEHVKIGAAHLACHHANWPPKGIPIRPGATAFSLVPEQCFCATSRNFTPCHWSSANHCSNIDQATDSYVSFDCSRGESLQTHTDSLAHSLTHSLTHSCQQPQGLERTGEGKLRFAVAHRDT